jgi:subtilisin family serine protease
MNKEESFKITSNYYADLIVDELMLAEILDIYPNVSVSRINRKYSIAYIPIDYMKPDIIYSLGYEAVPKCFGLMTDQSTQPYLDIQQVTIPNKQRNKPLNGSGVLFGFVDTGIDYRNSAFQSADSTTRIVSIWDQTIETDNNHPNGFFYGAEFTRDQINLALASDNPLGIVPSIDEVGHGTFLAGVAGGTYNEENNFIGVAPGAEYVIVKLKQAKPYLKDFYQLPQDAICYQENDIMNGINYLVNVSSNLGRPIAICIGMGTSQSSHLGDGIFHDFLSNLGRMGQLSFVVAAGNEGNTGHHFYSEIEPSIGYNDFVLNIAEQEEGFAMEFWGNAPNVFAMDIYAPNQEFVGRIPTIYAQQNTILLQYDETDIYIDNTLQNSLNGDQLILMRFNKPISGTWRFRVSVLGNLRASYHVWLPIYNFIKPGTYFMNPNIYTTITMPGNEETVITVTAYNTDNQELYPFASRGFTKENHPKPDIAAPGVNILGPTINNQYMLGTGTSVATAYTTGAAVIIMEWGLLRGNIIFLPNAKIRSIITGGAVRYENMIYPNPDWGFGILSISNSIILAEQLSEYSMEEVITYAPEYYTMMI